MLKVRKISCIGTTPLFDHRCENVIQVGCANNLKTITYCLLDKQQHYFTDFICYINTNVSALNHIKISDLRTSCVHHVANDIKDCYLSIEITHHVSPTSSCIVQFRVWYQPMHNINHLTLNQVTF